MEGFWDKFKKGAQEVGEKAAQLGKIARLQTEITALNTSKGGKLADLGRKVYSLYKEGKLSDEVKESLKDLLSPIEEVERKVEEKEKEIAEIKKQMGEAKESTKEEIPKVKESETEKVGEEAPAEKPEEEISKSKETKKENTKEQKSKGN
jgi:hypothetical protein